MLEALLATLEQLDKGEIPQPTNAAERWAVQEGMMRRVHGPEGWEAIKAKMQTFVSL